LDRGCLRKRSTFSTSDAPEPNQPDTANNLPRLPQSAALEIPVMVRNGDQQARSVRVSKVSANELARSNGGKAIHPCSMVTATVSAMILHGGGRSSGGRVSPSLARLSRYPRMASAAKSRASSRVSPWVTRPGALAMRSYSRYSSSLRRCHQCPRSMAAQIARGGFQSSALFPRARSSLLP
jgi:hypothetical protein